MIDEIDPVVTPAALDQEPEPHVETESPFLNEKILREHGLKPEALGILSTARARGHISPQEVGRLIPKEISQDNASLKLTLQWLTQLFKAINIEIVIDHINHKDSKVESQEHTPPSEGDATNSYYRAVKTYELLKHEKVVELERQWRLNADYEARNTIVVHNLRFAMKIARGYMGRGLDYDDLVQEGNIGLIVAAERFEPERGSRFTTYAGWWVKQHMTRAIQNFKDIIRIPVHAGESLSKVLKITGELATELGREPFLEEIAARAGIDTEEVDRILHNLKVPVTSLEELVYSNSIDHDATLHDTVADQCFPSAFTALEAKENLDIAAGEIRTFLAVLKALPISDKHKTAFKMLYGLEGHREDWTLDAIGKTPEFGVSRERIRQRVKHVWEKITEYGIVMDDPKLVAILKRVHDLENIVGIEVDISTPTETIILNEPNQPKVNGLESQPTVPKPIKIARLDCDCIIRLVATAYNATPEILLGETRPKDVVRIRWICIYIMREEYKYPFVAIGQALHYREHTAVTYGYRSVQKAMQQDPSINEKVGKIVELCRQEHIKTIHC